MICTVSAANQPLAISEIRNGHDLRTWRFGVTGLGVRSGGQRILAELLGISPRRLREWESGEHRFPQLLPSALRGIENDLRVAANRERRRRVANRKSAWRRRSRRRRAVYMAKKRAEDRAELREIRARGDQLAHLLGLRRTKMQVSLRAMSKVATRIERAGQFRDPDAPIFKPIRLHVIKPRKIRSDLGGRHRFRGRPGKKLRPEDIAHAE